MEFTTDEQEAVAVTTALQEEIFLEMGVGMFFSHRNVFVI